MPFKSFFPAYQSTNHNAQLGCTIMNGKLELGKARKNYMVFGLDFI